jgi:beta-carotene ketolase (CrtO type)
MLTNSGRVANTYDVIVVGGGHNGLTSAAYLAKAGRRVLVLERRPVIGGMCTSEETVPEAPGYVFNTCAIDTALTNIPSSVLHELELHRYGLRFVRPDPWAAYLNHDGASIAMWADRSKTEAEIARFSRRDAEQFRSFCDTVTEAWWAMVPYFQGHPTRPDPKALGQMLWRAAKGRRSLRGAAQVFLSSPEQVLEERFEREEVKAALGNIASWSNLPLQEDTSAGALAMAACYFKWPVTRPVGGAGKFTQSLTDCILAHGGEVRADAKVAEILVDGQGAYGIELEDGQELRAQQVIGALDPMTLMRDLVDARHVPQQTREELRGLGALRWNISCMKADVVLDRAPKLACGRELLSGYLLMAPTLADVRRAQNASMNGEVPDLLTMAPILPALIDRTQVPPGSKGETVYLYIASVPLELSGGRDWDDVPGDTVKAAMDVFESYAPGFKDSVQAFSIQSPKHLATKAHRGCIYHADMNLAQMGPWRPTKSLAGYDTPIPGLWHTGAGAHPFGALHGWSGRTTARSVDRHLRRHPTVAGGPVAPRKNVGTERKVDRSA